MLPEWKRSNRGNLEVWYLVNDKKFPKGFRPAFTLKEGYIVVASSPEVLKRFAAGKVSLPPTTEGTPLMRLSLPELTRLLKDQRPGVLALLEEKYGLPPELAAVALEELLGRLDQFEEMRLTQHSEGTRDAVGLERAAGRAQEVKRLAVNGAQDATPPATRQKNSCLSAGGVASHARALASASCT